MTKILVIEDEARLRNNILTLLENEGFCGLSAENGEIGLKMANEELPDLILCDVIIPKLDGFRVLEALRSESKTAKIPVILVTAKNDRASWRRGMTLGANDYLTKPFTMVELQQAMKARLTQHEKIVQESPESEIQVRSQMMPTHQGLGKFRYEEQFRKVFEEGPLGMAIVGLDYRFFKINHRLSRMLGYTEDELSRLTFAQITHPDDVDLDLQLVQQLERGEIPHYQMEKRYIKKNGAIIWIQLTVSIVRDENEQALYFLSTIEDISDRKAAQQQIERQLAAIEAATDAIAVLNERDEYIYLNTAYIQLFGYNSADELLGKTWREWYDADECDRIEKEIFPILMQEGQWRGEITAKRRDGSTFTEELALKWIEAIGLICVCRDITQRKRAEEEVLRSLAKERELNELKNRFISMTSHEFRNPLSSILMSAEMLEAYSHKWDEDKKSKHFNRIKTCTKNLTALLDDILFIGRANSGRLELKPQPMNLELFCRILVEEFQVKFKNNYRLIFETEGKATQVCMDERLVRHILENLLSNAIKYSPEGGEVKFELSVTENKASGNQPQGKVAILRISDSGIGIPAEDLPQLFESFHRSKNVGNISGTGLGLTIVKQSVDLHGGSITVESQVNVGTTFTVSLPLNYPL